MSPYLFFCRFVRLSVLGSSFVRVATGNCFALSRHHYFCHYLLLLLPTSITMNAAALIQLFILIVLIVTFQVLVGRIGLDKEAQRRWQHALTGQALVGCSHVMDEWMCLAGLLVGMVGLLLIKFMYPSTYIQLFGPLLRPRERENHVLPGAFYFLLGTFLVLCLVPLPMARYAVLCLSYADPVAAWIGRAVPLYKIHDGASLGGCVACFVTACLVGVLTLSLSVGSIFIGATACTVAEALPLGNDNLLIPLMTAMAVEWLPWK